MNSSFNACAALDFVLHGISVITPLLQIEILVGTSAFLLNLFLIAAICKVKAFHSNLRCLLAYFSICLAWFSFTRVYKACGAIALSFDPSPCASMKSAYRCGVDEILISIPAYMAPWSFFGLCVERLYATLRYKSYESSKTPPWVVMLFIAAISAFPIGININTIFKMSKSQLQPLCEGLLSTSRAGMSAGTLWLGIMTVVICLASTVGCKFWNDYKMTAGALNRAKQTLASRYQVAQNVQINRMLLPTMLLQTLCNAPHFILLTLLLNDLDISLGTRAVMTHSNFIWRLVYALLHPILAFQRIRHLRQQLALMFPCIRCKSSKAKVAPIVPSAKMHFDLLEATWHKARETRRRTTS